MYYCKECKKVHNTFIDHVKNLIEKYEKIKINNKQRMYFQRKKIKKQIEDVLNMYIETEKYPPEMINRILEIVKSEHIAKEHFRKQRDNAIIRYDNSKSNKHQISN